jgi:putative PEP-CTERM system histidine kinase
MPDALPLLAAIGYALATLAYMGLTGLIVAGWKTRPNGRLLALAATLTTVWGASLLLANTLNLPSGSLLAIEAMRNGAWLALLFHILRLREPPGTSFPTPLRILRIVAALLVLGFALGGLFAPALLASLDRLNPLGQVTLSVTGIVLVEQIYRGSRREDRWAIKFLCLGLGSLFLYDFYLYAHAALFQTLDAHVWAARGYAVALVAPLIAISAARNPGWAAPVSLSRSMAFHTASLLGAGIYLLVMAGAGYYLKLFGGAWGDVVRTVFVFAAALLLILLMVSGTLRARLRVFMSKHFFSYRYDYREEWLKFTRALTEGRSGEQLGERTIEALARLVESPSGALWAREGATYQRAAHWNWADLNGSMTADSPFLTWLAETQWVVDLDEMQTRRDLYGELEVPAWISDSDNAWLVVPLMLHDELLGFVVLKHSLARLAFNWEISDLLKVAARQAAAHLAQMRASDQLIVARQFESFNRTTTFVIHDLKNLVAQLSLLLANAEKHQNNPEFQADMLETVENAVARMNKVLAQLRRTGTETLESLPLADILRDAVDSKQAFKLRPALDLPPPGLRVRAERERLTRAIGHLVQNALEATPAGGSVTVSGQAAQGWAQIEITDTGSGMEDEFIRTRLFAPFDSTKGAGMGIGAYECRETLRALGGTIEVHSQPGKGTRFRLTLPLDDNVQQGDIA